jgi:hypothetical protein
MTDMTERCERLTWPTYLVSAMLVLFPLVDLATAALPINIRSIQWRFGIVGLLSGGLVTPILGILLSLIIAALADRKLALRIVAIIATITGALILLSVPLFILDAVQMRARAMQANPPAPGAAARILLAASFALLKLLLLGGISIVMARVGFRAARKTKPGDRKVALGRQGAPLNVAAASASGSAES